MNISAAQVKDLREKTGVGMMECKKALVESNGDIEKAVLWLREHGMARAQKKAGRVTAEGMVEVLTNSEQNLGIAIEVNCETDFVAKSDDFKNFVAEVAELTLNKKAPSVQELLSCKMKSSQSVSDALTGLVAKIGENIQIRRVDTVYVHDDGIVASYSHMGGRIGTLVAIEGASGSTAAEIGKELAMHVAASAPRYLASTDVPATEIETEKELARKKLLEEGKPANMVEKIMEGQINKFFKEICFIEQPFVKDPKITVKQYVAKLGSNAKIVGFKRLQLGEGVEKNQDDFATEVAKLSR